MCFAIRVLLLLSMTSVQDIRLNKKKQVEKIITDQGIILTSLLVNAAGCWAPCLGAMGIDALAQAPRFTLAETQTIGPDVMHRWRKAPHSSD